MFYVGLTDDPGRRRELHGNPLDWHQSAFSTEDRARAWETEQLARPDTTGAGGETGWRYGYWYTIIPTTRP